MNKIKILVLSLGLLFGLSVKAEGPGEQFFVPLTLGQVKELLKEHISADDARKREIYEQIQKTLPALKEDIDLFAELDEDEVLLYQNATVNDLIELEALKNAVRIQMDLYKKNYRNIQEYLPEQLKETYRKSNKKLEDKRSLAMSAYRAKLFKILGQSLEADFEDEGDAYTFGDLGAAACVGAACLAGGAYLAQRYFGGK